MNYNDYRDEAVELLKQLISTPSISRDEEAAATVFAHFIEEKGLKYERIKNNIIVSGRADSIKPTLLLNAHIDTVKPVSSYTRDPYTPQVEDGRLYGLGSNDCGGGLVSLLQAFRILSKKDTPYNIIYVASAEEEVSGRDGIELVLPRLPHIDVAIVGEPTGMQPATAEKGLMVVDATAHGRSGHAARNEGLNAIYEAMDDIAWLRSYRFERESELLGAVKTTVTVINAGTQHNVIPDECRFTIDIRTNECYTNEEVFSILDAQMKSELRALSFRLSSSHIDANHPLVQRCRAMGMQPFGSPTLSDQALMPFPSLKLGPGQSARSHSADEYIEIDEIGQAISTYVKLISIEN